MSPGVDVYLWGTRVGTAVLGEGSEVASFEYDRDFLPSGIELSPLVMPLAGRVYSFPALSRESFHGLPGLLADSLPDKFGNAVIDAWLDSQGRSRGSMNAVERLCYTGTRGMGALEFVPALSIGEEAAGALDVARLAELAQRILSQRESFQASSYGQAMNQILRIGTSAGGARAKALVAWNEETGDIRSGQVQVGAGYGHWLLKFDGVSANSDKEREDAPHYTRIEYAYHLMAREAGIQMTECRLYAEGGRSHFLTKRFDRTSEGDKLHMQTLGALAHFDFNIPGAHSYEEAAQVMYAISLGQAEIEQLFCRMTFNVCARNQDDHVKNISFLMDRSGAWSLAPAYDVTYAYNPGGVWTGSHQMSVNGKRENITADDLLACARHMNLRATKAREIVGRVREAVRKWPSFAERAGLTENQTRALEDAFVPIDA